MNGHTKKNSSWVLCYIGATNIITCWKKKQFSCCFSQDFWKCRFRQEHQGCRLCTNREELCPSQVEGITAHMSYTFMPIYH